MAPGLPVTVAALVGSLGGKVKDEATAAREVTGFATLADARTGDLAFYGHPRHRAALATCAGVVVLNAADAHLAAAAIVVDGPPRDWFARALAVHGTGRRFAPGMHPAAVVDATARLGPGVHVGAGAVIGAGASVGADSVVLAGAVVVEGCVVGDGCVLHENCVIGAEGFGLHAGPDGPVAISHQGRVVLADRVAVGAGTCIDRGMLADTRIGAGTKIDNLVQVGHNVVMGENCVVCGHVAIAGSATIGAGCTLGGAVAVADHVTIAPGVSVMGGTAVIGDLREAGATYGGPLPHMPAARMRQLWRGLLRMGQGRDG